MDKPEIADTLHLQTATIAWAELQRFFAAGKVISVAASLDLVAVATAMVADDKARFEQWRDQQLIYPLTDGQARFYTAAQATLWAVVVSPWVLVQEPATEKQ